MQSHLLCKCTERDRPSRRTMRKNREICGWQQAGVVATRMTMMRGPENEFRQIRSFTGFSVRNVTWTIMELLICSCLFSRVECMKNLNNLSWNYLKEVFVFNWIFSAWQFIMMIDSSCLIKRFTYVQKKEALLKIKGNEILILNQSVS